MRKVSSSNQSSRAIEPYARFERSLRLKKCFQSNRTFQELMLEAVDEGFSLLGDASKCAIYLHMEQVFNVSREEIADKVAEFAEAIEKILGPGAELVEIQIMKHLYQEISPNFKYRPIQKNLTFSQYVGAVRTFLCGDGAISALVNVERNLQENRETEKEITVFVDTPLFQKP